MTSTTTPFAWLRPAPLSFLVLALLPAGAARAQTPASFGAATSYATGATTIPRGVAVGDVNGDGRPDIVTGNYNGTASVLLGQAGGTFAPVSIFSTGVGSSNQGVADVSGDRRPDIVTTSGNSVSVLLNTGTFAPLAAAASAAAAEVALFPNPAQSSFTVQLPAAWGAGSVQATLLNALGQVVGQQTAALPAGAPLAFATDGLAPGVYQVRMQTGSHAITKCVVIK
ncbi:FG-GAP-like repeat-containing protein [Hymenobacter properus]|uniref:T9SS type A sorting domain-containing protein n=1 Tax=Hymenobacter properus TaxID=2791026 RepID=A0A931BJ14_9BACT|nr:FG-GAP-like repeat-containing protein [Hymenobacter properus]MBF9142252.1 T9SS type A sorting domain-containing protein [Hymenobacter properus]MBR7721059.1 T9SS type A sorting domain-containing protein [Microvirga sp. SRT04]